MSSSRFSATGFATIFALALFLLVSTLQVYAQGGSTISGFIYDDRRNPLSDVDVELLDEIDVVQKRTRTNSAGKYEFTGLSDGRWQIRALPFRYNLHDKTETVTVHTLSILGTGSSFVTHDMYLQRKGPPSLGFTTGVVFAQEIPPDAEVLYEEGVTAFENKNAQIGVEKLTAAIEKFPTYYSALQKLGVELMSLDQNMDAVKCFIRAAEVNPKSTATFYNMGMALNKLGKEYNDASLVALNKAKVLAPDSYLIELQMGKIYREKEEFEKAEEHLLKAKKLAESSVPEIHKELAQLYGNDIKDYRKAADELEAYMRSSNQNDSKMKAQIDNLRRKAKESS
ncbi:MAG: hypothetical protein DWQ47_09695 [Acidobacteria bacterium]|nr:MAG: hypothetical protein DWQ32_17795 [Acidobacteriota bacterium]REJ98831.1 MAG: hypothetical protein DWQ38_12180 [Acidobacteriota bacterium]REK16449.1 MAG: hypothetical protein DWQ43_05505 [Acidobacteriota bacterium]REK44130.1 MAG: hypothetical protein DWQ47_09695 [Acidobacteriota bacterium]